MKEIPDDASVCASSEFVSHLALREHVFDINVSKNKDADYLMVLNDARGLQLINLDEYELLSSDNEISLWKRVRQ